eukprot:TRINITY_DN105_c0_g1_i1.p1 TRINITY_DN105_c0_g1~~TRINITY_DN105_c0_g1_i1.p1  ORF type:complete len:1068 (+),score=349.96 TRINITY_DN105_c0_g1_i1:41-3244(+)
MAEATTTAAEAAPAVAAAAVAQPQVNKKAEKRRARMSSLDIRAVVANLRATVLGMRVSNVYDVVQPGGGGKMYAFKMGKANEKAVLLVEAGTRIHTTRFHRQQPATPSVFTMKLRKHIRDMRVEAVSQLGVDRVVDLTFGVGERACHIIVEMYAQGNLILTDNTYLILASLRTHKYDQDTVVGAKHSYPLHLAKQKTPVTSNREGEMKESFCALLKRMSEEANKPAQDTTPVDADTPAPVPAPSKGKGGKGKRVAGAEFTVLYALNVFASDYGASAAEHAILTAGLKFDTPVEGVTEASAEKLFHSMEDAQRMFDEAGTGNPKGYIILANEVPQEGAQRQFVDFAPVKYAQHAAHQCLEMETFDKCVDEYFAQLESQQADRTKNTQEGKVARVRNAVSAEQERTLRVLREGSQKAARDADFILSNLPLVDRTINELRALISTGVRWKEAESIIAAQRKTPNSVANIIQRVDFANNKVTLLLPGELEEGKAVSVPVEVDLALSAHANAEQCFHDRKVGEAKAEKTAQLVQQTIEKAERKSRKALSTKAQAAGPVISMMRKKLWFEKFHWFFSSEGFVVISGKDAQQNDLIYRRYLNDRDLYVHADLSGASSCVIMNPDKRTVGVTTLEQAGRHAVCWSVAWANKIVTSAWWVRPEQVSKTAPTGEYIATGSFMIRGKKNFLPPQPLVMGVGLMFVLDAESVERRRKEAAEAAAAGPSAQSAAQPEAAPEKNEEEQDNADEKSEEEAEGSEAAVAAVEDEDEDAAAWDGVTSKYGLAAAPVVPTADAEAAAAATDREREATVAERRRQRQLQAEQRKLKQQKANQPKTTRGKKAKLKKLKKYEDQDEEDRELRLKLLGAQPMKDMLAPSTKEEEKTETVEKEEKEEEEEKEEKVKADNRMCYHCGSTEHLAKDCPRKGGENCPRKGGENAAKVADEEENENVDETQKADVDEETRDDLARLTGEPRADDVLTGVVPVCAPWDAVQHFKFKLKLTPGSMKRGKAAQQAMRLLLETPGITAVERQLITQQVTQEDLVQCVLPDCKIVSTGNEKSRGKGGKGGKKKGGKSKQ